MPIRHSTLCLCLVLFKNVNKPIFVFTSYIHSITFASSSSSFLFSNTLTHQSLSTCSFFLLNYTASFLSFPSSCLTTISSNTSSSETQVHLSSRIVYTNLGYELLIILGLYLVRRRCREIVPAPAIHRQKVPTGS